ncbi:hypothetical protein [Arthrobacter sp. CP30]
MSIFLALVSMGIALSTLFVASVAIKIVMLVVAAFVLAATGAALAVVLAQSRPPAPR